MSNSYGFNKSSGIPEWAEYGVYDSENGEWTGQWFSDYDSAQSGADDLDQDGPLGIVSTTDETDWL